MSGHRDLNRYDVFFLEMNMKQSMVFVFIVLLLFGYYDVSAQQTQSPWLIGRWDGNIEGFTGRGGASQDATGEQYFSRGHDSERVGNSVTD